MDNKFQTATEIRESMELELEKQRVMDAKLQQFQQMIMQQQAVKQKSSFMAQINPKQELEDGFNGLALAIDEMYEWAQHAKDPLGNFLPEQHKENVRAKFHHLKWLMLGMVK